MHFVGIDLAWGERAASGVAVLDGDGSLAQLTRVTTDDDIARALELHLAGDCVVGIDAPLIVTNATGNRAAEAALNRDFARFDAGTHPTNRAKAEFTGVPRGARLAARLGLDLDPASPTRRRALEVYPHAALVALFRLGRTLKYKQRSGRPFALLRAEMQRLITLLESLETAQPALQLRGNDAWEATVAAVAEATRKSELRRVEDQLDAVVCAYVALLSERAPEAVTHYGDPESGRIVTPTLPDGLTPAPRSRLTVEQAEAAAAAVVAPTDPSGPLGRALLVRQAVRDYEQMQPRMEDAARRLAVWLTTVLDDAGINYQYVAWRGKSVASFAAKADRVLAGTPDGEPLADITDQIGARVITYVSSDVTAVADQVRDQLGVVTDKDLGRLTADEGRFGYGSRHLQVQLSPLWLGSAPVDGILVPSAQIQIRTVLQHAWAEFEHDIRYKGTIPEALAPDLDRRFTLAAGLLELADREFEVIRESMRAQSRPGQGDGDASEPRIGNQELAAFLAGHYPDAGWSRTDHYAWISGLLLELGITSLRELADLLRPVDSAAITERMDYRYPPGAVRRLDDALLASFGTRYLDLPGNAGRAELLRVRWEKLRGDDD